MQSFITRHRHSLVVRSAALVTLSFGLVATAPLAATEWLRGTWTSAAIPSLLSLAVLALLAALVMMHRHDRQGSPQPAAHAPAPTDDRLEVLFHSVPVAIMVVRLSDGHIVEVNSAFSELWGYTRQEACGHTSAELDLWIEPAQLIQKLKANRHADTQEFQVRHKSGEARDALVSVTLVHFAGAAHLLITAADVTERRQAREMSHVAHHDTLTSLPNRLWLLNELENLRHRPTDRARALLFIDLDRFKAVNDTLGHKAGDELLRLAAQRMQNRLRASDTLARLGGDEFVALLDGLDDINDAERIAADLVQIVAAPFHLAHGKEAHIGASIGISPITDDAADIETLIQRADTALYAAKAGGRNTVRVFDGSMSIH